MALVEFHQILLSSTDGKDARLLPVPVHPGPSLALVSLHRHFPNAVDLHYRPDLDTLVTLPKVCKGQQNECEGVVNFPTEGTFFILPFLDPSVIFYVTAGDNSCENLAVKEETELSKRVSLLEDMVMEQRLLFASITSLLSQGVHPANIDPSSDRGNSSGHLEKERLSLVNNLEVCSDCGGASSSCLDPESKEFFPSSDVNSQKRSFEPWLPDPNSRPFEPTSYNRIQGTASVIDDNMNIKKNGIEETSKAESLLADARLNPECSPFDPNAISKIELGDNLQRLALLEEEDGDEDFNNNIRERTGTSKEHSPMIKNQGGKKGGGDLEVTTSFHTCAVDEVISNDQKCTRIRPKIVMRRS